MNGINNAKSCADKSAVLNGDVCIFVDVYPDGETGINLFYDGREEQLIKLSNDQRLQLIKLLSQTDEWEG